MLPDPCPSTKPEEPEIKCCLQWGHEGLHKGRAPGTTRGRLHAWSNVTVTHSEISLPAGATLTLGGPDNEIPTVQAPVMLQFRERLTDPWTDVETVSPSDVEFEKTWVVKANARERKVGRNGAYRLARITEEVLAQ